MLEPLHGVPRPPSGPAPPAACTRPMSGCSSSVRSGSTDVAVVPVFDAARPEPFIEAEPPRRAKLNPIDRASPDAPPARKNYVVRKTQSPANPTPGPPPLGRPSVSEGGRAPLRVAPLRAHEVRTPKVESEGGFPLDDNYPARRSNNCPPLETQPNSSPSK